MAPHKHSDHPNLSERVLSQDFKDEARRLRFDGTVNLGHVLTMAVMLIGGIGVWTQGQISASTQNARMTYMEKDATEIRTMLKQVSETQQIALRNQDKVTATVEILAKKL